MTDTLDQKQKFEDSREMVSAALCIAEKCHRGQFDRDGFPHLFHSIRISNKMETSFLQALALLHDVPEDSTPQGKNRSFIIAGIFVDCEWPEEMYLALDAITRQENEDYGRYIERVSENESARAVKIKDLVDNLTGRSTFPTDRQKIRYEKALTFLTSFPPLA